MNMGDEADADWNAGMIEAGAALGMPVTKRMKVQAQHLQPGDVVGSGEIVEGVTLRSLSWPSSKCLVRLNKRDCIWGRYTMIGITRKVEE